MIDRRSMMAGGAALGSAGMMPLGVRAAGSRDDMRLRAAIVVLEQTSGGRLGVAVRPGAGRSGFAHRGDEAFPMCSTFKLPLVAAVLHRVDRGNDRLDRAIAIGRGDIVDHAPFCAARVGGRATVAELCAAALLLSDNSAANLLLPAVNGPAGLTAFLRMTGDPATRLDRTEPSLNIAVPGDPRDTTTPVAMAATVDRLLTGRVLRRASRARLSDWMLRSRTGDAKFRAGVPQGWRVGDRTGRGGHGTNNEIGILYPPTGAPIAVASFLTSADLTIAAADAVHRDVARAVVTAYGNRA